MSGLKKMTVPSKTRTQFFRAESNSPSPFSSLHAGTGWGNRNNFGARALDTQGFGKSALAIGRSSRLQHHRTRMLILAGAFFVIAACCSTRVMGQAAKYETIPMHRALTADKIDEVEKATKRFVSSGEGNQGLVTAYFLYYVPAALTAADAAKDTSRIVSDVSGHISRVARSSRTDVFQKVTGDTFKGLKKVAEGNYSPSSRISAIVLMSQLDQRQADNASKTPPVPLMANLPVFMEIYSNEKNSDGVRAAALQGMNRLVTFGFPAIAPDVRAKITADMMALLDSSPPMFRTEKVHAYLQRYAVDMLATLAPENDPTLGQKLISISGKPENQDLIALYSASKIGRLGKSLEGKVAEPEKVLKSWSKRALAGFEAEIARIEGMERLAPVSTQPKDPKLFLNKDAKNTARKAPRMGMEDMNDSMMMGGYEGMEMDDMGMGSYDDMDMGMGYGMGMMGAVVAKPQPPEVIASRRRLNYMLQQLYQGATGSGTTGIPPKNVGGLLASLPADKKTAVADWVSSMDEVVTALNDNMLDDQTKYLEGLQDQAAILRELVGVEAKEIFKDDEMAIANPAGDGGAAVAAPAAAEAENEFSF
ncbi:hypothetical protein [Rubripirellula reticaptiva]|uniref:Uncharacterized protein n=1 Tax=Rubripirellula reticaptiva TaxID=2528013 RepID=A0A5C6ENL7_9BACT|nr:hypothetical protein [Rubripirellula reticaptiva]TWU51343.1 hypothetical protein Poly59_29350 [Rubripirellula reticaptiva]